MDKKRGKEKLEQFAEVKLQSAAPLITFKLGQGKDLGKNLMERRKKKKEPESTPGIDSPENQLNYTTTVNYDQVNSDHPQPHASPSPSIKSDYQSCS